MNKPLHDAELKINELFGELGLLEPYARLNNPDYVTPYEKTIKIIAEALADQRTQLIQAVADLKLMGYSLPDDYYNLMKERSIGENRAAAYNNALDDAIKLIEGKE